MSADPEPDLFVQGGGDGGGGDGGPKKPSVFKQLQEKHQSNSENQMQLFAEIAKQSKQPAKAAKDGSERALIVVKLIVGFIKLCIYSVIFIALAVITYKFVTQKYPRPIVLGHTEPFEHYMLDHVTMMCTHLKTLHQHFKTHPNESAGGLKEIVNTIFKQNIVREELDLFSIEQVPIVYVFFIFRKALSDDLTQSKKFQLSLFGNFFGGERMTIDDVEYRVYNDTQTEMNGELIKVLKEKLPPLEKLFSYYAKQDCLYRGCKWEKNKCNTSKVLKYPNVFPDPLSDPTAELARLHLDLLAYKYAPVIHRMYDMRKSGGIGNFTIFNLYMEDYIQFVFHEQIKGFWKRYPEDSKQLGYTISNIVTSKEVSRFFQNMPLKIAGLEEFKDKPDHQDYELAQALFWLSSGYERFTNAHGETEEHFVGILKSIGRVFKDIGNLLPVFLKIGQGIVSAITNPFKILRILIGLIMGLIIYMMYLIIVAVGTFLFGLLAYVYMIGFNILRTVLWTLLFVVFALIYLILTMLDFVTGGLILKLLRCENLPSTWHDIANAAYDNRYKRNFLCSTRCHRRYVPDGVGCARLPKTQPSFCLQQLIVNTMMSHYRNSYNHPSFKSKPMFYEFVPSIKYFSKTTEDKKLEIDQFYENRLKYFDVCDKSLREYDFLSRYVCENFADKWNEDYPHLKRACRMCYCGYKRAKKDDKSDEEYTTIFTYFKAKSDKPIVDKYHERVPAFVIKFFKENPEQDLKENIYAVTITDQNAFAEFEKKVSLEPYSAKFNKTNTQTAQFTIMRISQDGYQKALNAKHIDGTILKMLNQIDERKLKFIHMLIKESAQLDVDFETEDIYYVHEGFTARGDGKYGALPKDIPKFCLESLTAMHHVTPAVANEKQHIIYHVLFTVILLIAIGSGFSLMYNNTQFKFKGQFKALLEHGRAFFDHPKK